MRDILHQSTGRSWLSSLLLWSSLSMLCLVSVSWLTSSSQTYLQASTSKSSGRGIWQKRPFRWKTIDSYLMNGWEYHNLQDAEHVLSKCMADYDSETGHDTDTDSNHVSRGVSSFYKVLYFREIFVIKRNRGRLEFNYTIIYKVNLCKTLGFETLTRFQKM